MSSLAGAFAGALGFACMYHLSGRHVWLAALAGLCGQLVFVVASRAGWNDFSAMAAAAFAVTMMAEAMARTFRAPTPAYLVCGLIPLVPGRGIFLALRGWILGSAQAADWGRLTFLQGAGIAVGCLAGAALVRGLLGLRQGSRRKRR